MRLTVKVSVERLSLSLVNGTEWPFPSGHAFWQGGEDGLSAADKPSHVYGIDGFAL